MSKTKTTSSSTESGRETSSRPDDDQDGAVVIPIESQLDLHAFAPRDIPSVTADYIDAAHDRGLTEVRLVHGRGSGVQRAIVQKVLATHPLVAEFWDDPAAHLGATCARLAPTSDR